jgi:hypothetical protein
MVISTAMVTASSMMVAGVVCVSVIASVIMMVIIDQVTNTGRQSMIAHHAHHRMPDMMQPIHRFIVMILGVIIASCSWSYIGVTMVNASIADQQVSSTISAFNDYYDVTQLQTSADMDLSNIVAQSMHRPSHTTVSVTYVDPAGRMRNGSIVFNHGHMTLFESMSYVYSASLRR